MQRLDFLSFLEPLPEFKSGSFQPVSFRYHFTLLQPDKAPFTRVNLVLVSQLLNRHRDIVTGAQMSVEMAARESFVKLKELFIYLLVYFFSLLLLCHLRAGHGSVGLREQAEICGKGCFTELCRVETATCLTFLIHETLYLKGKKHI